MINPASGPSATGRPPPEPHRFPCAQCGASLKYAPGADVLRCGHCGHENRIAAADAPIVEQDFRQTLQTLAHTAATRESVAVHCDSCGASYSFDAAAHAGLCPFCGAPAVAKTEQHRQLQPQALLPFQVTRDRARESFQQWLGSLWFAPGKLKDYARDDANLSGMYVPSGPTTPTLPRATRASAATTIRFRKPTVRSRMVGKWNASAS